MTFFLNKNPLKRLAKIIKEIIFIYRSINHVVYEKAETEDIKKAIIKIYEIATSKNNKFRTR
jgi:hypothetical protein